MRAGLEVPRITLEIRGQESGHRVKMNAATQDPVFKIGIRHRTTRTLDEPEIADIKGVRRQIMCCPGRDAGCPIDAETANDRRKEDRAQNDPNAESVRSAHVRDSASERTGRKALISRLSNPLKAKLSRLPARH